MLQQTVDPIYSGFTEMHLISPPMTPAWTEFLTQQRHHTSDPTLHGIRTHDYWITAILNIDKWAVRHICCKKNIFVVIMSSYKCCQLCDPWFFIWSKDNVSILGYNHHGLRYHSKHHDTISNLVWICCTRFVTLIRCPSVFFDTVVQLDG